MIGGGALGAAIAYHLRQLGVEDVVLLERDALASGSTSKAAGGIRTQFADEPAAWRRRWAHSLVTWSCDPVATATLSTSIQNQGAPEADEVAHKINRLPLSYVDKTARGDLLSRVTNDIDNLGQSLQFSTSQVLTAALTIIAEEFAPDGVHRHAIVQLVDGREQTDDLDLVAPPQDVKRPCTVFAAAP